MMICRHCGKHLPDVLDAFCPHCGGELANVEVGEADATASAGRRNRLWIQVVVAARPGLDIPPPPDVSISCACLLGRRVRPFGHRQVGWMMGLILGIVLAV